MQGELSRHGNQYRVRRSHTKTHEPAMNSLATRTADSAVDALSDIVQCRTGVWAMFRNLSVTDM